MRGRRDLLLNSGVIAIDQDPLGHAGTRLASQSADTPQQVWYRPLSGGEVAVALYNKGSPFKPPPIPVGPCASWVHNATGYYDASGGAAGNLGTFTNLSSAEAQARCCANPMCTGFSYRASDGSGYWKRDAVGGFVKSNGYEGYARPSQVPHPTEPCTLPPSPAIPRCGTLPGAATIRRRALCRYPSAILRSWLATRQLCERGRCVGGQVGW